MPSRTRQSALEVGTANAGVDLTDTAPPLARLANVYNPLEVALPVQLATEYSGLGLVDATRVSDSIGMMAVATPLVRQASAKSVIQAQINALTAAGGNAGEISRLQGLLALNFPGVTAVPASGLALAPSSGHGGTTVTISATAGLVTTTLVSFGTISVRTFTVVSDTQMTTVVPSGTGVVSVSVTGAGGTSAPASFTYD